MYLLQKIEELARTSSDTRGIIAAFVLENRNRLSDCSIEQIAQECFASKAAVVRFAKALGFNGWRDFYREFVQAVAFDKANPEQTDLNFPFQKGDSPAQISQNIASLEKQAIDETQNLLDAPMLALAARKICGAGKTVIFAISPNQYLAQMFCRKLMMIGIAASVAEPEERGIHALQMTKEDCALVISYSGNRKDTDPMRLIPILQAREVFIIGITSAGTNYIRQSADCVLTMASREHLFAKISSYSTEISLMYLLNCLYSVVFEQSYDHHLKYKLQESRLLEQRRYAAVPKGAGYPPAMEDEE